MTNTNRKRLPVPGAIAGAIALATLAGAAPAANAGLIQEPARISRSSADGGEVRMAGLKWCFPVSRCLSEEKAEPRPRVRDRRGRPRVRDKRSRPRVRDKRDQRAEKGRCRVYDARTGRCRIMDYR